MELKQAKICKECNGNGGGHRDYLNSDGNWERGTGDWENCDNCGGTGEEPDEEIVVERIIENLTLEQENKLQEIFNNEREIGGIPITKDNCEDLFDNWLGTLLLEDLIKYLYA